MTFFRTAGFPALLLPGLLLAGCSGTMPPPDISYDDASPAVKIADPPPPVTVVPIPEPLPLPGQLKPVSGGKTPPEPASPATRIDRANAAARIQPVRDGFLNAIQVYPYSGGAFYQVYAAPGQVTDIALQEGERLVGAGPVAAGDTVRWIIGDTESGIGACQCRVNTPQKGRVKFPRFDATARLRGDRPGAVRPPRGHDPLH